MIQAGLQWSAAGSGLLPYLTLREVAAWLNSSTVFQPTLSLKSATRQDSTGGHQMAAVIKPTLLEELQVRQAYSWLTRLTAHTGSRTAAFFSLFG